MGAGGLGAGKGSITHKTKETKHGPTVSATTNLVLGIGPAIHPSRHHSGFQTTPVRMGEELAIRHRKPVVFKCLRTEIMIPKMSSKVRQSSC